MMCIAPRSTTAGLGYERKSGSKAETREAVAGRIRARCDKRPPRDSRRRTGDTKASSAVQLPDNCWRIRYQTHDIMTRNSTTLPGGHGPRSNASRGDSLLGERTESLDQRAMTMTSEGTKTTQR